MKQIFKTVSDEETRFLAKKIMSTLPLGSVVLLTGDLGAGKTTFVKGVGEFLCIKDKINSPTFNIMKVYLNGEKSLIHIDAYRLEGKNIDIGLDEYIGYENGYTMIEWPMYIESLIPSHHYVVEFKNIGGDNREISFEEVNHD